MAILTNDQSLYNSSFILQDWINDFLRTEYNGGIGFITNLNYVEDGFPHIIFRNSLESTKQLGGDFIRTYRQSLVHRRIVSAQYYFEHSDAEWFAFINGDTHVYIENIPKMLRNINIPDPTEEIAVIGQCLNILPGKPFIQGGSGYLMSRAAVMRFLGIAEVWKRSIDFGEAEDVEFTKALRLMGLRINQLGSQYFMGQYCSPMEKVVFEDFDQIPQSWIDSREKCPKNYIKSQNVDQCPNYFARFRDVVFFHRLSTGNPWKDRFLPLSHYPSQMYWKMEGHYPKFCMQS